MKKYSIRILLLLSFLTLFLVNIIPNVLNCNSCSSLNNNDYTLKKYNVNKDNQWATFRDDGNGTFFIHPGKKSATKGEYSFKKNANLILTFSIRSGSKYGNIKFYIEKNNEKIAEFIITTYKNHQIITSVDKTETLSITADKNGAAGHDWGNLKIINQYNQKYYTLSKIYNSIIIHKNKFIMIFILLIIILLYIELKNHQILQGFEKSSLFIKILQIVLILWIFTIPIKNSLYQISTALIIILFLIHFFYYKQKSVLVETLVTYKKLFIVISLFMVSMIISSLLGISEKSSLTEIIKYVFRYLLVLVILFYFYKQTFFSKQWLTTVIFVILIIHALNGVYQYITGFDLILNKLTSQYSYKLTGAVFHHNPFGLLMALGAIISLTQFFDKNNYTIFKHNKIIYIVSLLLFLFSLFHSQSRSAWIMFGVFFIGYITIYLKQTGFNKKLFTTIIFLLITSVLMFSLDENLLLRLTQLIQADSSGRSNIIWPFTIDNIMNSPVLGYGINTYKLLDPPCCAGVHNLFLELLLYTGIIGFGIFTYLIWLTLKESFTKDKILYFILLISFIVLMQFDGSLIDSKVHTNIFILMLFFIFSSRLDKKSSS